MNHVVTGISTLNPGRWALILGFLVSAFLIRSFMRGTQALPPSEQDNPEDMLGI